MIKYSILFILINYSWVVLAQQNLFPDTLMRDKKIDYVLIKRDCYACKPVEKDKLMYKCFFDNQGLNYKRLGFDEFNKPSGMILHEYKNGKLSSYTNYNTYSSIPPDFMQSKWDSASVTQKVIYDYKNDLLAKLYWFEEGKRLSMVISYDYDDSSRVFCETQLEYENPEVFQFEAFKPNSSELSDSIRVLGNSIKKKTYKYSGKNCDVEYYVADRLTGKEYLYYDNSYYLTSKILYNSKGKELSKVSYTYDLKHNIVEKLIKETGYDGFGNGFDFPPYDRITYNYDKVGRIIMENKYRNGKLIITEKYQYVEK